MAITYQASTPRIPFPPVGGTVYNCWPNKIFYDASRGKFVLLHNANDDHLATTTSIIRAYFLADGSDTWTGPVTVALNVGGLFNECEGCVQLANGDYIAYLATRSGGTGGTAQTARVLRSTDGGQTWNDIGPLKQDGVSVTPQLLTFAKVIASGHILLLFTATTGNTYVIKINPATPAAYTGADAHLIDRTAIGSPPYCGEARFIETTPGNLVCICRRNVDGIYTTDTRAGFITSTDNGDTWTNWVGCGPVATEMTNGNLDAVSNGDGTFDLYFSSRRGQRDGLGQIWWSRVTSAELMAGSMGRPTRLFTSAATRDSGYPGVAQNTDGSRRIVVWYDGVPAQTDIFCSVLTKVTDTRYPTYVPSTRRTITSATRT